MITDRDYINISIPYELATYAVSERSLVNKYETNQVIRALDTWLVLKHETTSGLIQCWNKQKDHLLKICKCSETVFRHRIKLLLSINLVSLYKIECRNDSIKVCSWDQLGKCLGIDTKNTLTIQYKITDDKKIFHWLIATDIQHNKNRQDIAILTKLEKNPEVKAAVIAELIKTGADQLRLDDLEYFLTRLRLCYFSDFVRVSEIHDVMIQIRPDNNRGVRAAADAWGCKHPVTVSYWKKILHRKKVIDVSKLQVTSQNRVRNKECRVLWLKKEQQTLLCLCDQIEILMPWLIQEQLTQAA
jgi:hypothetical protein